MEDVIFIKRNSNRSGIRTKDHIIKLDLKRKCFTIFELAADLLNVKEGDGLMFAFNQKNKKAWVCKDDEEDAFKVRKNKNTGYRMTSKELVEFFDNTFDLLDTGRSTFRFKVEAANEKGLHPMLLLK